MKGDEPLYARVLSDRCCSHTLLLSRTRHCGCPSQAWFEDLGAGGVTSVSFAAKLPLRPERDSEPAFTVPDFIVGTRRAYAVACEASAFEELDPERRCVRMA